MKLENGEKYLYLQIVGHNPLTLFPNRNKTKPTHPDYVANGCGIWVREKKEQPEVVEEKIVEV